MSNTLDYDTYEKKQYIHRLRGIFKKLKREDKIYEDAYKYYMENGNSYYVNRVRNMFKRIYIK